ncbi:MAG: RsbRD N-terminal domain-containing protein [Candidatus Zixiibacteriota bacterium]
MKLEDLLVEKKKTILENWFQLILESYPPDSVKFFKNKKDQFQNPVGHAIQDGIEKLFDGLLGNFTREDVAVPLDKIIKIRSVQDFSPSQAIAFIHFIKKIVRDALGELIKDDHYRNQLYEFDCRVDRLALYAFDCYMQCREKLYEIKVREAKAGSQMIIEKLNRRADSAAGAEGEKNRK